MDYVQMAYNIYVWRTDLNNCYSLKIINIHFVNEMFFQVSF